MEKSTVRPMDFVGTKSQASFDREISAINHSHPDSKTHIEIQSLSQRIGGQAVLGPRPILLGGSHFFQVVKCGL